MNPQIVAADLFAGAGGSAEGLVEAARELGREVDLVALNHNRLALETHAKNHPTARHIIQDIRAAKPIDAVPSGRLDILLAGAPCPHHSHARGARSMDEQERNLPREIHRWHEELDVDALLVENVPKFEVWGPLMPKFYRNGRAVMERGKQVMVPDPDRKGEHFKEFVSRIRRSGFKVEWRILNTANYGAATARTRLFVMAKKKGEIRWPTESHARAEWTPARDIIDWSLRGKSIFHRKKPIATATMKRILGGYSAPGVDAMEPLISKYYGTGIAKPVSEALDTITTRDRFALIQPVMQGGVRDLLMRMLQPAELARAMGFRADYWFSGGRADKIRQIGNAWECVLAKKLCLSALAA